MGKSKEIRHLLEALHSLLLREKEALIKDDVAEVVEIVEEKITLAGRLRK